MKQLIFLLFFLLINTLQAADKLEPASLQLSWFDQFQFAGYYIAKEKGFYKEVGLDVDIKPFQFGLDITQQIDTTQIDFAVARETLILEKAAGKNIVALFATFQSSPIVLLSTKKSGINTIQDFKNKRIMITKDDSDEVSLKAMMGAQKIDFKSLKLLDHSHNINDLINRKTDIISAYISKTPLILQQKKIEYNVFSPKDYGFDLYSDILYTSQNLIANNPQKALRFKEASLKGWNYAYNNIEESVDLILRKYNTQKLSREELIYEAKELKKLSYLNDVKLGTIKLNKMQRIIDLYNLMGLLPNTIDLDQFIFNDSSFYSNLTQEEKNFIKTNSIITVGEEKNLKPLTYFNDIGIQEGIVHDYLKIISDKTGLRFISDVDTTENLRNKLQNKKIDFMAISTAPHSQNVLNTRSYIAFHKTAFKLHDTKIDNKDVITVGLLKQFNQEKDILQTYPKAQIDKFITIDEAVQSLLNKKIDLLYVSEEILLRYIQDHHITSIEYASNTISPTVMPLSFSLNTDSIILHNILSKAFTNIRYSQHESIKNRWIPIMIEKEYDWSLLWQVLAFLIIIIAMIIYKQFSMNKLNNKLKIANMKLKELSECDHLTNLYNRRYFESVLENILSIESREKNTTSLLMFDIDDFKKINDTYGHQVGDKVLVELAKNLKNFSRRSDIIARVGGEEFLILLPNTSLANAKIHCDNLRKMIENLRIKDGKNEIKFTVSMGLTRFKNKDTLNSVLLRTDDSLYQVKRNGKNHLLLC